MIRRLLAMLLPVALYAGEPGADVPWIRYEAEAGVCLGAAVVVGPSRQVGDLAGEAAGRRAVRLAADGDGVAWTVQTPGDGLVVRACIPDRTDGAGEEAELTVQINGRRVDSIHLTSRYAWLYGREDQPVNDPHAGPPRRIYDESHLLLRTPLRRGDRLSLVRGASGPPGAWGLDFAELEAVAPPLPRPADLIDVAAAGVTPENCSERLPEVVAGFAGPSPPAGKRGIWLGPGRWRLETLIRVPHLPGGFTVQGAGMWHTALVDERGRESDWGTPGFNLDGATASCTDFAVLGGGRTRKGGGKPFVNAYGHGSLMRNLWIEHMTCGFWVGGVSGTTEGLRIEDCRLRNLGADGINLCNGTRGSVVSGTSVRASGDDGIAIWSAPDHDQADGRGCSGNRIERCTVELPWRAAGIAIYGGGDNTVRGCVVRDTLTYPGLTISSGFKARAFWGTTLVEDVRLERCGGSFWNGQRFGAIWVQAADGPVAGVLCRRIAVVAPTFSAVHLTAAKGRSLDARFEAITVREAVDPAVLVQADAGKAEFLGCDLGPGARLERHGGLQLVGAGE